MKDNAMQSRKETLHYERREPPREGGEKDANHANLTAQLGTAPARLQRRRARRYDDLFPRTQKEGNIIILARYVLFAGCIAAISRGCYTPFSLRVLHFHQVWVFICHISQRIPCSIYKRRSV